MTEQIALITGAATGIGAAVATSLAGSGVKVAVCDINREEGAKLAKNIGGEFIRCDVSRLESVQAAVKGCVERFGTPDYVHLNAGIMTVPTNHPFLAIEDVTELQYRKILGVNLDGVFYGTKTVLPLMREKGGAITLTASMAGLGMVPGDPLYTATKYAVIGFGRAVAAANEGSNVRINVICPGVVDTDIVPDPYKAPEFGMMPTSVMAAEIVDLLCNGANGEVRVKSGSDRPAYTAKVPELN